MIVTIGRFVGTIDDTSFADLTPIAVTDIELTPDEGLKVTFASDLDDDVAALVVLRATGQLVTGGVFATGAIGQERIAVVANENTIPDTGGSPPIVGRQNAVSFFTAYDDGTTSETTPATIHAENSGAQGVLSVIAHRFDESGVPPLDGVGAATPAVELYGLSPTAGANVTITAPLVRVSAPVFASDSAVTIFLGAYLSPVTDWAGLTNSWAEWDAVAEPVGLRYDAAGTVHMRGRIKTGTLGSAAFTIPTTVTTGTGLVVSYRPTQAHVIAVPTANAGTATLVVGTDGTVTVAAASTPADAQTWTSLCCSYTTL